MSALSHYLEQEGIPTTQVSLVREHTEVLSPPRALWVPFMLGRPLGVPNNAEFQRRVLLSALRLLERTSGPVLEDFPEDAPADQFTPAPDNLVCPVSFVRAADKGTLVEQLTDEVSQLDAWHTLAVKHHGRTTLGVTGLSPMQIARYLAGWLRGDELDPFRPDIEKGDALKQACDELRAFYLEAKAFQPGVHTSRSMHDWFWFETAGGQTLVAIKRLAETSADPSVRAVSVKSLIPRTVEAALQR